MTMSKILLFFAAIFAVCLLLPLPSDAAEGSAGRPALLELMTLSCPACREMGKVLAEFEAKHGGAIEVRIIDVREDANAARLYQVRYVPTLVFLDEEGKVLETKVGYIPLEALEKEWYKLGYSLDRGELPPR
ncbi:MAG: thioredoxin family protein [Synergistaceae bacterium]|nr:thioredoxin family protein [Synergistota bacterium]NLM71169.1 thioredoxin family protein [Synergistaceae bacterium]